MLDDKASLIQRSNWSVEVGPNHKNHNRQGYQERQPGSQGGSYEDTYILGKLSIFIKVCLKKYYSFSPLDNTNYDLEAKFVIFLKEVQTKG